MNNDRMSDFLAIFAMTLVVMIVSVLLLTAFKKNKPQELVEAIEPEETSTSVEETLQPIEDLLQNPIYMTEFERAFEEVATSETTMAPKATAAPVSEPIATPTPNATPTPPVGPAPKPKPPTITPEPTDSRWNQPSPDVGNPPPVTTPVPVPARTAERLG